MQGFIVTLKRRGRYASGEESDTSRSCCSHLGGDSPFALKLGLVPLKCLLSTVLELVAVVVLWETVLGAERMSHTIKSKPIGTHCTAEFGSTMGALSNDAEDGRVARCFSLELAALLGGHRG